MKKTLSILLLTLSLPALADRLPLPPDTPASYRNECGSCHLAYPPQLLAANDWQQLMQQLDQHFSSDATVDRKSAEEISRFLNRHGGSPQAGAKRHEKGQAAPRADTPSRPDTLPRISQTARFQRQHREIPGRFWRDARVQSPANCEACHRNAGQGRFSEHDIVLRELRE